METKQATSILSLAAGALALLLHGAAIARAPAPQPDTGGVHNPEHQIANLGAFTFRSGEVVNDFKVSYVTHGQLNQAGDNVILAMHFFAGDHHGYDFLIGPGNVLDTEKYFIVATDFVSNAHGVVRVQIGDYHALRAFLGESFAHRCADTARATGDDYNFIFKIHDCPFFPLFDSSSFCFTEKVPVVYRLGCVRFTLTSEILVALDRVVRQTS